MTSTVNVSTVQTSNTFDHWRIQTNLIKDDTNEIARGDFIKPTGNVTINVGRLILPNATGTMLDVTADARISGKISIKNFEQDGGAAYLYSDSADIKFRADGTFHANGNTRTRYLFNNNFISAVNINGTGFIFTTGTYANANNFLNVASILTVGNLTAQYNVNISSNLTVTRNVSAGNINIGGLANLSTANIGTLTVTNLTVQNPITAPSESDTDSYRLRVAQSTRGDGTFGVFQGTTNGNAAITFSQTNEVWRATANDKNGSLLSTLITVANVKSTYANESTNVGSLTVVKGANDNALAAYGQANSAANTARVSANGLSTLSAQQLNFVNSSSVLVSVVAGAGAAAGNANVSFTVSGTTGPQGTTGAQGTTGTGTQGATGSQGTTGTGTQGATGSQGTTGSGTQGTTGAQGTSGSNGSQGATGTQGTTGTGTQGATGTNGTVGYNGGLVYSFSTATTDSDPGNGIMKFNSGTIGSVTFIYIDNQDQFAVSQTGFFDALDDSNSSGNRSTLSFVSSSGAAQGCSFRVTGAVTVASGYYKIPVSYLGGSLPTNGHLLSLVAASSGAQGPTGIQGSSGAQGSTGPSTAINATAYSSGTYYPVMVATTGSNQTPIAHTTLSYATGTLSATDFSATSDARLKNVTGLIANATEKLSTVNGVYYNWNNLAKQLGYDENRGDREEVGLLAQEVQAILPQAVYEDERKYLRISYDRLVPVLIQAIKELSTRIEMLEGRE